MKQPTICSVMLVNGRRKMVTRAIASWRSQTMKSELLIFDTGNPYKGNTDGASHLMFGSTDMSIGNLRNEANGIAGRVDIIVHWDSDDWSHPRRIEEQVALLQASGKQCVGYKDMLFWDSTPGQFCGAWLYSHATKPLGTSLCYWREVWVQRPFEDLPKVKGATGEDVKWIEGIDHVAISSHRELEPKAEMVEITQRADTFRRFTPGVITFEGGKYVEFRMVASIHGLNTQYYNPAEGERLSNGTSWRRAAEWDKPCARIMAL